MTMTFIKQGTRMVEIAKAEAIEQGKESIGQLIGDTFNDLMNAILGPALEWVASGFYHLLPEIGGLFTLSFGVMIMATGNFGKWGTYYTIGMTVLVGLLWIGDSSL